MRRRPCDPGTPSGTRAAQARYDGASCTCSARAPCRRLARCVRTRMSQRGRGGCRRARRHGCNAFRRCACAEEGAEEQGATGAMHSDGVRVRLGHVGRGPAAATPSFVSYNLTHFLHGSNTTRSRAAHTRALRRAERGGCCVVQCSNICCMRAAVHRIWRQRGRGRMQCGVIVAAHQGRRHVCRSQKIAQP